jgi:hypothetical protein
MCDRMPTDLFGYYLPPLDFVFPVLDHIGLFIALHAHVLVRPPNINPPISLRPPGP